MKQKIKSLLKKIGRAMLPDDFASLYPNEVLKNQTDAKVSQLILQQQYKALLRSPERPLPAFKDVGFRQYSQFEEDGILLYLFSIITPQNRTCLEICAGNGVECNTTNLIINHGWQGCLFDGKEENVKHGTAFFASHKDTFLLPPTFKHAWITAENINQLVTDCCLSGKIDLLSLDVDGNDYWIWKALTAVEPTVVVCEIMNLVPPELALTIPYDPNFRLKSFADDFWGASLRAMVNLGRAKGYRLVGTHRFGFNAFFVKNGVADELLPEVTPESCATDPYTLAARKNRWPKVKDKPWVAV